jgi:hypothetical protein
MQWIFASRRVRMTRPVWETGWDIHGGPGNRVPMKSFDFRQNTCHYSRLSHNICKRKYNDFLFRKGFPVKGKVSLWKEISSSQMNCFLPKRICLCKNHLFLVKGNNILKTIKINQIHNFPIFQKPYLWIISLCGLCANYKA